MNATIRPEQVEETPEVDNDLAAVSEVDRVCPAIKLVPVSVMLSLAD